MSEAYNISRTQMVENNIGLPAFDIQTGQDITLWCKKDLKIECLCASDAEIYDGFNLLVKVNNAEHKEAYMLMVSVDYYDFVADFYGGKQ
tara:strand:- start:238 stop:507 length:270 start_codon:yes stop_codon:yes gene_type:complete